MHLLGLIKRASETIKGDFLIEIVTNKKLEENASIGCEFIRWGLDDRFAPFSKAICNVQDGTNWDKNNPFVDYSNILHLMSPSVLPDCQAEGKFEAKDSFLVLTDVLVKEFSSENIQ